MLPGPWPVTLGGASNERKELGGAERRQNVSRGEEFVLCHFHSVATPESIHGSSVRPLVSYKGGIIPCVFKLRMGW
jgi:hypothetical protein